ncbi:MAG: Dihydrolipoamide acetyltransferase [Myxococcaceae bacterium]|nr:Dihydrolipoamide acetyltransferase [Myxococcaceae bacterium]
MRRFTATVMVLAAMAPGGVALAQQIGDGGTGAPVAATPTATPTPATTLLVADGGTPGEAPAVAPTAAEVTGEQYVVRLRNLEQRINELKEEIFRSKARLSLLAESVLQNAVGGSRAQIVHQNEMGGSYRLATVVYSLDGAPIFNREDDTGALADRREFQIYNGQLGSGDHSLGVNLTYIGAGLPYMRGYRFSVRSTQSFSVPEGKAIQIRVVGFEKGGPLESPETRPAVRYVQRVISLREAAEGSETTPAAPAPTGGNGPR